LVTEVGHLHAIGVVPFFTAYISQDEKNSSKIALHIGQGGIGLPDRDYYFDNDSRTSNIRNEYVLHVQKMFQLMGDDENTAKKNAATVMRLETSMAERSRKLAALRNPQKNYNKIDVAGLTKLTPSVDWKNLFGAGGINSIDTIIVGQPEFFVRMEELLKQNGIDDWKTYLRWNLINVFSDKLSKPFDQRNFISMEQYSTESKSNDRDGNVCSMRKKD
jgi:putative endopeptidase